MVLHLGDVCSPSVLAGYDDPAIPLRGVFGNNDSDLRRAAGDGGRPSGRGPTSKRWTGGRSSSPHSYDQLQGELSGQGRFDLVLFGHTHRPAHDAVGKALVVNPGGVVRPHAWEEHVRDRRPGHDGAGGSWRYPSGGPDDGQRRPPRRLSAPPEDGAASLGEHAGVVRPDLRGFPLSSRTAGSNAEEVHPPRLPRPPHGLAGRGLSARSTARPRLDAALLLSGSSSRGGPRRLPVSGVKAPRLGRPLPKYLTPTQVDRLLAAPGWATRRKGSGTGRC